MCVISLFNTCPLSSTVWKQMLEKMRDTGIVRGLVSRAQASLQDYTGLCACFYSLPGGKKEQEKSACLVIHH